MKFSIKLWIQKFISNVIEYNNKITNKILYEQVQYILVYLFLLEVSKIYFVTRKYFLYKF